MAGRYHPFGRAARALTRLFGGEAGAGILLLAVAALALAAANSPWHDAYHWLLDHPIKASPIAQLGNLHAWINDGLMAVFFFVVGLEIKREVLIGELSSPGQRRLPLIAALAGMALPALVYLAATGASAALIRGWAIPAATDIAFALGVLALVGRGLPPSLRLFLLTVAIVDDLGAVAIIALVYTASIALPWLGGAGLCLAAMAGLNLLKIDRGWPYALLALACWYAMLHSGVHATIAGVLAAWTIPLRLSAHGDSLLLRMEHALVPWSGYLVVPLFGLANAGVALSLPGEGGGALQLPLAVGLGLLIGKQAGIAGAIWLSARLGIAVPPGGASWRQMWGVALLCGIGFTMSLFIAPLAFPAHPGLVELAKLGVLAGSLASAVAGYTVLRGARPAA